MKAIIFNGSLERRTSSTSELLSNYIKLRLEEYGIIAEVFNLAHSGIPLFDSTLSKTPKGVELMNNRFLNADVHFWLAPLYHGSIPGVMKNCLDWLEISAHNQKPYLIDKIVGLICWADGAQALNGINTMDVIAKSLRAWPLPFSVPITRKDLFNENKISDQYREKLDLLIKIAVTRNITVL